MFSYSTKENNTLRYIQSTTLPICICAFSSFYGITSQNGNFSGLLRSLCGQQMNHQIYFGFFFK